MNLHACLFGFGGVPLLVKPHCSILPFGFNATGCNAEIRYSANHNLLRTVGFITMLAAVGPQDQTAACHKLGSLTALKLLSGAEHPEGGLAILCPPMFLMDIFASLLQLV